MIPWNDRGSWRSHRIKSGTTLKCFVFIQNSEKLVSVCVWVRDRALYEGQTRMYRTHFSPYAMWVLSLNLAVRLQSRNLCLLLSHLTSLNYITIKILYYCILLWHKVTVAYNTVYKSSYFHGEHTTLKMPLVNDTFKKTTRCSAWWHTLLIAAQERGRDRWISIQSEFQGSQGCT